MFCAKIQQTCAKSWHRLKKFIVKSKIILYIEVFAAETVVFIMFLFIQLSIFQPLFYDLGGCVSC